MISGRILLTGGTGRLGRELKSLLPEVIAPSRAEVDITRPEAIAAALQRFEPEVVVHAAAYTDVARAERDRQTCWRTNVDGTRSVVQSAIRHSVFLVHISTDYVFEGTRGMYKE
jgi:dTDP-4-dehydrorhamnose reductase